MNPFKTKDRELKVWCKKEKSEEGEPITAMYLEEECLSFFGYWHNADCKRLGLPFISRKDVKIGDYKRGVVPMTIVFKAGHDDMVIKPLEMPKNLIARTPLKSEAPQDKIWQSWCKDD
jgi:hypothetical protein